jgi:AraC-like DNA-binding protein
MSYNRLLDQVLKDAAERYLSDSPLSIAEVAYLLGYSEPAAFNRAFKRWYGETPQTFRQRVRRNSQRLPAARHGSSARRPLSGWIWSRPSDSA